VREGDGPGRRQLVHGICERCINNFTFQTGVPLQEYLDSLFIPVLAVDSDIVVQMANTAACRALGKELGEIVQHRGGNVFECAHARLPEGCGKTIHCSGCVIRRAVTTTYETGEAKSRIPATLCRKDDDPASSVDLTITTVKAGNVVILRVDRMK
jgi:PAS domain-containing protein